MMLPIEETVFQAVEKVYLQFETMTWDEKKKGDDLIFQPYWESITDYEVVIAKAHGFIASPTQENHDDLLPNLERLFCSGFAVNFLLASQMISSFVFSEKNLHKTILGIYKRYASFENDVFLRFLSHRVGSRFSRLDEIRGLLALPENTIKDIEDLKEVKIREMKRIVSMLIIPAYYVDAKLRNWLGLA